MKNSSELNSFRKVEKILTPIPTLEGAGVHLHRIFGFSNENIYDPFLLLDDFSADDPDKYIAGFPQHPHRGIETITYLISGSVNHADSLGNKGTINPGDIQWMTAGSGIIHEEMPQISNDGIIGFQLWANLPKSEKMTKPKYRGLKSSDIPIIHITEGVKIKLIAGTIADHKGPIENIKIQPIYAHISINKNGTWNFSPKDGNTLILYIFKGELFIESETFVGVSSKKGLFLSKKGELSVIAGREGVEFLLISGNPLNQPIAWGGPIVMNSHKELQQAFQELKDGTFVKP